MSLTYRNNITGSTVKAVKYLEDGSNVAFVRYFISKHHKNPSAWRNTPTSLGGARNEIIYFCNTPVEVFTIKPGDIVYLTDSGYWSTTSQEDFQQHFTEIEGDTVYVQREDRTASVHAMQWRKGINDKEFCDFVVAQTSGRCSPNSTGYDGNLYFYPDFDRVEVFNAQGCKFFTIQPYYFFVVVPQTHKLPLVIQYDEDTFDRYYTKPDTTLTLTPTPTPKESSVTTTEPSEYSLNRDQVLDALAVLRCSPTDSDFELTTVELMGLLADAYNTGWDAGMDAGQTNPYMDWK